MRTLIIFAVAVAFLACKKTVETADKAIFKKDAQPEIKMEDFQQWLNMVQNDPAHPYNSYVLGETDGEINSFSLMVKYGDRPILINEEIDRPHFNEKALEVLADAEVGTNIWLDNIVVSYPERPDQILKAAFVLVE